MWTFGEGLVVNFVGNWGQLVDLRTGERWESRPEDVPLLQALAAGVPDQDADSLVGLETARQQGWAVQTDDPADAFLAERLEILDRRYAWCAADVPEGVGDTVRRAHASRRHYHRGFGQYAALPETVLRRVALLGREPRRVLVLGDDDFVSLGLAAAGHDVVSAEIDPAIVAHAQRLRRPQWKLAIIGRDFREPWPEELTGSFDAFFADPLSGPDALRLFVARGLASLVPDGTGYLCVSELGQPIFERLRRTLDLPVLEHYSDFNHYYDPYVELAQYVSDMMVLRPDSQTRLSPDPSELFLSPGMSREAHFDPSPASRYVMHGINTAMADLIHIDTAVQVLTTSGQLDVVSEQRNAIDSLRSYLCLTRSGSVVHIRSDLETGIGQLFVAPADHELEDSILALLFGLWRVGGTVVQKHRIRNSSVMRLA